MDRALKRLNSFLRNEVRDRHTYINHGGCCVFATLLAKHLMKVGKVKIRVQGYGGDNEIDDARKNVRRNTVPEWNNQGVNFNHIALEFIYKSKRYRVDADGVTSSYKDGFPPYRFRFVKGELTLKEASELGSKQRGWNDRFNRREIPTIKRLVDKFFRKHLKKTAKSVRLVA